MNPIANMLSPTTFDAARASQIGADAGLEEIKSVGTEFEGVFLSMMLKEMRNSLDEGGFFGGEGSDTYGGMFDMFIGQHLAQATPLGIGEMLIQQYAKQNAQSSNETTQNNQGSVSLTT